MESAQTVHRHNLLLIEDNPGDARLVREALRDASPGATLFDLDWAEQLQTGLQTLSAKTIHLVLLDLSLPDTNGLATVRRVLKHAPGVPVVVLTGTKDEFVGLQAIQLGAQDYIVKGEIEGKLLSRSIRYAMERAREARKYRDLFENANDMICTVDLAGRFTSINRKGLEILGYSRDELIGTDALHLTLENLAHRELEVVAKNGARIPLEGSARIVYEQDQAVGIQAILRDIRERRRLEGEVSQANKLDALGRLAGGVAHDFNNLLTVIGGHAHLSLSRPDDAVAAKEDLLQIIAAADRAASLTRQLLAFSRKQVIQPRVLDVERIVTELGKFLQRLIGENIELVLHASPDLGRIKADHTQIEQVIMNLALNARDAMPRGGKLLIEASNTVIDEAEVVQHAEMNAGDYVLISVTDTGIGMDRATLDRIFEPFFTTKGLGKGTGLGLALVYGVVKQIGGHVLVYSEPGQGTTFKAYLPRVFEETSPSEKTRASRPPRLGKETILIVEDESSLRALVETALRGWGYNVLTATQGKEALSICESYSGEIHLIITDMVMPGMSGQELVSKLRESNSGAKYLFVSGYPGDVVLKSGAIDETTPYLQKPFALSQLSDQLRHVFDEPRM